MTQLAGAETEAQGAMAQFAQSLSPDILAQIQALPPEEQQVALMQMFRDYQGEQALAAEQLARGGELANTAMPEGRQAGRVYVAANPLEYLNTGLQRYQGQQQQKSAMAKLEELSASRTGGLQTVGQAALDAVPSVQQTAGDARQRIEDNMNKQQEGTGWVLRQ